MFHFYEFMYLRQLSAVLLYREQLFNISVGLNLLVFRREFGLCVPIGRGLGRRHLHRELRRLLLACDTRLHGELLREWKRLSGDVAEVAVGPM